MNILLTRDDFHKSVFLRDNNKCVICNEPAADAHHILERRLWGESQGYYLENGSSLCPDHHLEAEMTTLTVEEIRVACGIATPILPEHLYGDQVYDKWGNIILANGQRLKGELFQDEGVQKILRKGRVIDDFTSWVKYPRTHHLPWSPGMNDDDRMMQSLDVFEGQRVIVTEKMDGENTTMYADHIHARSVDSSGDVTRAWVKNFWANFSYDFPTGWRLCGENLYAEHSIHYNELDSFFNAFSIWNEKNECLSWDETLEWLAILHVDLQHVPVMYDGIFDKDLIVALWNESMYDHCEGYVVRIADSFPMHHFKTHVGKFVRKDHVGTGNHWRFGKRIIVNSLKE